MHGRSDELQRPNLRPDGAGSGEGGQQSKSANPAKELGHGDDGGGLTALLGEYGSDSDA